MPFDGKLTLTPRDRRRALIQALRSPMPEGFEFGYGSYDTCAVALALRLNLLGDVGPYAVCLDTLGPLGLTRAQAIYAFSGNAYGFFAYVSPHMVADRLEQI